MKRKLVIFSLFVLPLVTFAQGYGDFKGFGLGGYANTDYFSRTNITAQKGAPSSKSSILGKILGKISGKSLDDSSEDFNNTSTSQTTAKSVIKAVTTGTSFLNSNYSEENMMISKENVTDNNGKFDPYSCLLDPICSKN